MTGKSLKTEIQHTDKRYSRVDSKTKQGKTKFAQICDGK